MRRLQMKRGQMSTRPPESGIVRSPDVVNQGVLMITLNINGKAMKVDVDPDTPILWVLRDDLGMTGTKFGCGMALCGACTVHLDGQPIRSCSTPVSQAADKKITTIESMSASRAGKPVKAPGGKTDGPQAGHAKRG